MNWNEEWNTSIKMTSRDRLNTGKFWDERICNSAPGHFPDRMTKDQLSIVGPEADQRILEIGPGSGRLTIPMARSSLEVTVVDPSVTMLKLLEERSRSEDISNVRIVNDRWENVDIRAMGRYHKLVSSLSLFMYDIRDQMKRMNSVSDAVFLFVPADLRIPLGIQEILFGSAAITHTDFEILSNLAKDMGLEPHTQVLEYPGSVKFDSLSAASDYYCEFYNVPESKKEAVMENLSSAMIVNDGKFATSISRHVGIICWQNG
ncbi:MAG: methyltransferase domain-containing protein [Euryarchaeota archaeon]|nr:methyltransferase domain-containing protein [Euryarchaeota archaeon]